MGVNSLGDSLSTRSLAVYYIPPAESELFRVSTRIIGYNPRTGYVRPTKVNAGPSSAAHYGIHLTICDVLYFETDARLRSACMRVSTIAARFAPFDLELGEAVPDFPSPGAISISVGDSSGSLHALHAELLSVVNRTASASNYTLGLARADRPQFTVVESDELLRTYKAPYVLTRYQPHFTLFSGLSASVVLQAARRVQRCLDRRLHDMSVHVGEIAIMGYERDHWVIDREIRLTG
jgi:hypothetical protein